MKVQYDQAADALYITLAEGVQVSRTVQIDAGTLVDLDRFGNVRGIEVVRPGRTWPLDEILSRFSPLCLCCSSPDRLTSRREEGN
jgi:uncharacterized protein YuzE